MSAAHPIAVPGSLGFPDGLTPRIQSKLEAAARALRTAQKRLEEAYQLVEPESDTDRRICEALAELEGPIYTVEWTRPKEALDA